MNHDYDDPVLKGRSHSSTLRFDYGGVTVSIGGTGDTRGDRLPVVSIRDRKLDISVTISVDPTEIKKLIARGETATTAKQLRVLMLDVYLEHLRHNPDLFVGHLKDARREGVRDGKRKVQKAMRRVLGIGGSFELFADL